METGCLKYTSRGSIDLILYKMRISVLFHSILSTQNADFLCVFCPRPSLKKFCAVVRSELVKNKIVLLLAKRFTKEEKVDLASYFLTKKVCSKSKVLQGRKKQPNRRWKKLGYRR